jgi:sterol desaturase/sphingolipid hydroxylase (fatty acid hydroxylase superfamily)
MAPRPDDSSSSVSTFPGDLFGFRKGKLFGETSAHVKKEKLPGMSTLPKPTFWDWISGSPFVLIYSPNTLWCVASLAFYFAFPYDLSPTGAAYKSPFSWDFFIQRFPLWFCLTFGYTAFWHVSLYFWNWAKRPFIKDRPYNLEKVFHNMFWSISGIAIWTLFDNVFAFLWATGRLPYISDKTSFSTTEGFIKFALATMLVPVWRDAHFYFAHRLLHFKPLYMQVHSLHHRNTDIEPFSGLCMHPMEHLYYYACILPSLVFVCSPFAFVWNGAHLLLSPGASHSGYEDHFQADAFHYMHHRYFECNYAGFGASFLDVMMGTFTESMEAKDKDGAKLRADAKSTLRTPPTIEFILYLASASACVAAWAYYAMQVASGAIVLVPNMVLAYAFLAGFGPVIVSSIITEMFGGVGGTPMFKSLASVAHILVGTLFCSVPVTYACYLALTPK